MEEGQLWIKFPPKTRACICIWRIVSGSPPSVDVIGQRLQNVLKLQKPSQGGCRSQVLSQATWIRICSKVHMDFFPQLDQNKLHTPALNGRISIFFTRADIIIECLNEYICHCDWPPRLHYSCTGISFTHSKNELHRLFNYSSLGVQGNIWPTGAWGSP